MSKIQKKKETGHKIKSKRKPLTTTQKLFLLLGLALAVITALPAVVIILIGLLPTLTILITDPKNTNKLVIVGCFNLAGVFIFMMNIANHFSLQNAFFIVTNIFNLIIMLGSAAIGLIIYCEIPNIFIFTSKISAQKRLKNIDARLEKIAEEWGSEVVTPHTETAKENK